MSLAENRSVRSHAHGRRQWINRRFGDLGLLDRSSAPHHSPRTTPMGVMAQIETWRQDKKGSASRITHQLADRGITINRGP
jgi:hypothetical protein